MSCFASVCRMGNQETESESLGAPYGLVLRPHKWG